MTKGKDKPRAEVSTREVSSFERGSRVPAHEDRYADDDGDAETTRLLGAGTRGSGTAGEHNTAGNWVGMEDFKGLPWWKTPSVRCPSGLHVPVSVGFHCTT